MPRVLLAFDFGMRRIGVAVGQTITHSANPLTILAAQNGIPNWEKIGELIQQWQADALIVGVPLNLDGTDQPITAVARSFAKKLQQKFALPVFLVDERYTTKVAKIETRTRADPVDSYAAKLILESWLNENKQE